MFCAKDCCGYIANAVVSIVILSMFTHSKVHCIPSKKNKLRGRNCLSYKISVHNCMTCVNLCSACNIYTICTQIITNDVFVHQTSSIITRSSTSQTLVCPFACTCSYFNSFVPRTIHSWNLLPTSVTSINSIASFKLSLRAHILY